MGRVRIKDNSTLRRETRQLALWQLFSEHEICVIRIESNRTGFSIVADEDNVHKILTNGAHTALTSNGFEVVESGEAKANRTLVVSGLDQFVLGKTVDEIKTEIERGTAYVVEEVYKIPNTTIMKVRMKNPTMAKKALSDGLRVFSQSFPHHMIDTEIFIKVKQCFRL